MNRLTAQGRADHAEEMAGAAEVDQLVERWRRVCEGSDLIQRIDTVTGPTITTPQIVDVTLGPPSVLVVKLLPGQLRMDVTAVARRLAEGMGAAAIRVEQRGHHHVVVTLLREDPLAELVAPFRPIRSVVDTPPALGLSESGDVVLLDLARGAHVVWQGSSGSGKSMAGYALLAQLRTAADVIVTGSDPTGLLLGPWTVEPDRLPPPPEWAEEPPGDTGPPVPPPALGTADHQAHVTVLADLVDVMDYRIAHLPLGRDSVDLTDPATPLVLVVLEEWAGTLRLLEHHDKKAKETARSLLSRLASEGRKAGIRLLIMVQRADVALVDGYTRAQASHRVSWRIDSTEGLRMLHPDASDATTDHATAVAGVALLTCPGQPLTRFRSPYLDYAAYVQAITGGQGDRQ
ncbi:S-DNA-T family DNA segregation ATPase FtsK/SpoIIIE [Pseudonocardia sediminis]|uniref:S-DNA-T family DNA segregation ATPase FtsK/SpoIIIE n=1 Tax=Pseudonocardia sediminis TaxID=1397368 RepID=A0A4Q7V0Z6_PSEST|nr:hypothetical protein [Pseudonocardia sediminis]RZT87104.1 S-DNA-T family DNA segregation ATPase FtsK/SpoIIIE [Pseudonocardia sediminis]